MNFGDVKDEFNSILYDTNNFMDYSIKKNMFWKWQWNEIYRIHYEDNDKK